MKCRFHSKKYKKEITGTVIGKGTVMIPVPHVGSEIRYADIELQDHRYEDVKCHHIRFSVNGKEDDILLPVNGSNFILF